MPGSNAPAESFMRIPVSGAVVDRVCATVLFMQQTALK
jgi:hypothetical protein